jgi:hypothetical protein
MHKTVIALFLLTAPVVAQGGSATGQAATLQQFADMLKLDEKKQIPAVETIFTEAARAAAPVALEIGKAREKMLAAQLSGSADDVTAAKAAYVAAAARMTAIETGAYSRVYAILKPNQQAKTAEAFPLMAGLFVTQPRAARPGRVGGGQ